MMAQCKATARAFYAFVSVPNRLPLELWHENTRTSSQVQFFMHVSDGQIVIPKKCPQMDINRF